MGCEPEQRVFCSPTPPLPISNATSEPRTPYLMLLSMFPVSPALWYASQYSSKPQVKIVVDQAMGRPYFMKPPESYQPESREDSGREWISSSAFRPWIHDPCAQCTRCDTEDWTTEDWTVTSDWIDDAYWQTEGPSMA